jgi:glycosyltransferase involved in cell wall biosynthesis
MKVLLVFSSSEFGGAERSLSRMAFLSQEVNYHLATLSGEGPWCDWVRSEGYEPIVLGQKPLDSMSLLSAVWRLILYVRRHPVEIIYICGARASLLLRFLRFFLPGGTKLVHGVRWNPDSNNKLDRFFRLMERVAYSLNDAWITNSAVAKRTLVSRCEIPADKVFVIYNGLESYPKDVCPQRERSMNVLTVANLNPRKGHCEYLTVIHKVLNIVPNSKFFFVGRDDMSGQVQLAIKEAGLSHCVKYEGFQVDISPWFKQARVMVLPSLWGEGCPTSILEGFSFGLPVVAYAIDGIPELIKDGVDGSLVTPKNTDELAKAIASILNDPVRAEIMGMSGREKVIARFNLKHCANEHMRIFQKIISEMR